VTDAVVTTTAPSTALPVTTPPTTIPPTTSSPTTISTTTIPPTTEPPLPSTPYLVPLLDPGAAGWGDGHSGYPATDIFAPCGVEVVAPVNGELREVRTVNSWDPNVDNPATRGGRSVSIVGDDGVRYYLAHLDEVDASLAVGERVQAGARLGTVGLTGRTSACHVHFGIWPPCPGKEWSVRRGVIPPKPYLDAWRDGRAANPLVEVLAWVAANPEACDEAMADPFAADS
jgi:hypothetical protein